MHMSFWENPSTEINEYLRILYEPCLKGKRIHRVICIVGLETSLSLGGKDNGVKRHLCRISCSIIMIATCVNTSLEYIISILTT